MKTLIEFASDSPWLTFFLAWLLVDLLMKVIGRGYRTIMVSVRGWPPAHLDADGDWKKEERDE